MLISCPQHSGSKIRFNGAPGQDDGSRLFPVRVLVLRDRLSEGSEVRRGLRTWCRTVDCLQSKDRRQSRAAPAHLDSDHDTISRLTWYNLVAAGRYCWALDPEPWTPVPYPGLGAQRGDAGGGSRCCCCSRKTCPNERAAYILASRSLSPYDELGADPEGGNRARQRARMVTQRAEDIGRDVRRVLA